MGLKKFLGPLLAQISFLVGPKFCMDGRKTCNNWMTASKKWDHTLAAGITPGLFTLNFTHPQFIYFGFRTQCCLMSCFIAQ
ncbi:hypothetical protein EDB81DRAFT_827571 [Dactylonectria macrodidyma]|uniref:Uncharacterized protein n=1 Tax=Dactylonectria macrodidyma TaxID=307937 RepID=A0A9P9D3B2_9HYPO|nr:hypothetical protein EDB81DRAFT_827571 [Dactylonectria macrodidyma]